MQVKKNIMKWLFCLCLTGIFLFTTETPASAANPIRITCVGDSITDGVGSSNGKHYPAQLKALLGDNYVVTKCGLSGAFACESEEICWRPYIKGNEYKQSIQSNPDIVIIMIGTNDASEAMCWGKIKNGVDVPSAFREGYENLIKTYQNLDTNPRIILATPLSVSTGNDGGNNENRQYNNEHGTIPIIKELAEKYDLTLIDMFHITEGWSMDNYLTDGLHPNNDGYSLLARIFAKYIKNEENNLKEDTQYRIVSKLSGKALTIKDNSTQNDAALCQMPIDEDNDSQLWTLESIDGGYFQIINKHSGKALNVPNASTENGTEIVQTNKKNQDSQKWFIDVVKDSNYQITPKLSVTYGLDVNRASTEDEALIIQWTYTGGDNQQWQFQVVPKKYTVTFDTDDADSIDSQTVQEGKTVEEPEAPSKDGYTFLGWYLDEDLYSFDSKITKDITLTAKWEEIATYTVTFDPNNGESVFHQNVKYKNKISSPEIEPRLEGYQFLGWYLDKEIYDFDTEITNNITLIAKWILLPSDENDSNDNTQNGGNDSSEGNSQSGGNNSSGDNSQSGGNNSSEDNSQTGENNSSGNNSQTGGNNSSGDNSQFGENDSSLDNSQNSGNGSSENNTQTGGNGSSENNTPTGENNSSANTTPSDNLMQTGNTSKPTEETNSSDTEYNVGEIFTKGKLVYKITKNSGNRIEVQVLKPKKTTYAILTIPKSVTYRGKSCIVTSIAKEAFKNNKKLKKITIEKNISQIGKKAFYNCGSLNTVLFKKNNLKSVGSGAFLKTSQNLQIHTGKKNIIKKYTKLFKKKIPVGTTIQK